MVVNMILMMEKAVEIITNIIKTNPIFSKIMKVKLIPKSKNQNINLFEDGLIHPLDRLSSNNMYGFFFKIRSPISFIMTFQYLIFIYTRFIQIINILPNLISGKYQRLFHSKKLIWASRLFVTNT